MFPVHILFFQPVKLDINRSGITGQVWVSGYDVTFIAFYRAKVFAIAIVTSWREATHFRLSVFLILRMTPISFYVFKIVKLPRTSTVSLMVLTSPLTIHLPPCR